MKVINKKTGVEYEMSDADVAKLKASTLANRFKYPKEIPIPAEIKSKAGKSSDNKEVNKDVKVEKPEEKKSESDTKL